MFFDPDDFDEAISLSGLLKQQLLQSFDNKKDSFEVKGTGMKLCFSHGCVDI